MLGINFGMILLAKMSANIYGKLVKVGCPFDCSYPIIYVKLLDSEIVSIKIMAEVGPLCGKILINSQTYFQKKRWISTLKITERLSINGSNLMKKPEKISKMIAMILTLKNICFSLMNFL